MHLCKCCFSYNRKEILKYTSRQFLVHKYFSSQYVKNIQIKKKFNLAVKTKFNPLILLPPKFLFSDNSTNILFLQKVPPLYQQISYINYGANSSFLVSRKISSHYFHSSAIFNKVENEDKPSSQVEETVHHLKEKSQDQLVSSKSDESQSKVIVRKSLGTRIKEEILHYYHGFRLLFLDVKLCSRYVWRILQGENLSRREHRQLIRTTSDLFRLVPFSVFIIIPFMEFLLPVALKLFPGMLPSTFETTNEKEAKMKKTLKVKLEMAKFLQQTLDNMSIQSKGHRSARAKEFVEFFYEIQKSGKKVSNKDILKFSKLFEDELTLDSLTRPQLGALCKLLEMQPLGTNNFLRFQLRMKLRSLTADDKIIRNEGVDSLAVWELQHACRARGMRAYGLPKEKLRQQLQQWLDLSLSERVPPSLLLLSRTLFLPEQLPAEDTLAATISTLPEEAATRAKAKIGKREGKIDNQTRLEIIRAEEKMIREDKKEKEMEIQERKKKEETLKKKTPEVDEILVDPAPVLTDSMAAEIEGSAAAEPKKSEEHLTAEDIDHVEEALEMIEIEKKSAFIEETELSELKSELKDYEEDVDDFKKAIKELNMDSRLKESKAAQRLFTAVNGMIKKMDPMVAELGTRKETLKKQLEQPNAEDTNAEVEVINLEDLAKHMNRIVSVSDSNKVEKILSVLSKMDDDLDGAVKADHVMRVLSLLTEDGEGMSAELFEEVVEMMVKEDQLSAQMLAQKALSLPSISLRRSPQHEHILDAVNAPAPNTGEAEQSPPVKELDDIVSVESLSKKSKVVEEKR